MSNNMVHATVQLGAGGEVTAMAKVKSVGKVLGVMVMLAVLCPVVAQAYVWQPDGAIQCTGITAPTSGEIVAPLSEVTCTVAAATDWDQRMIPPPSQWFPDTFNNEDAYTWASAGSALSRMAITPGKRSPGLPQTRRCCQPPSATNVGTTPIFHITRAEVRV